jgi:hypothetical protein
MSMFQTYLMGLAVAHPAWFHFFTAGQLLRARVPDESDSFSLPEASRAPRVVAATLLSLKKALIEVVNFD